MSYRVIQWSTGNVGRYSLVQRVGDRGSWAILRGLFLGWNRCRIPKSFV